MRDAAGCITVMRYARQLTFPGVFEGGCADACFGPVLEYLTLARLTGFDSKSKPYGTRMRLDRLVAAISTMQPKFHHAKRMGSSVAQVW